MAVQGGPVKQKSGETNQVWITVGRELMPEFHRRHRPIEVKVDFFEEG